MRFAYADPPYLGCGNRYGYPEWNKVERHKRLIDELVSGYPDGWAMSGSSPSLKALLPICPPEVRIGAWVRPFASFKPFVNPAYTWEPVIFRGGRKRGRIDGTKRDHLSSSIMLKAGLVGAKPPAFCKWILDLLGFDHTQDTLDDLFPGTNIMSDVIAGLNCDVSSAPLFAEAALKDNGDG